MRTNWYHQKKKTFWKLKSQHIIIHVVLTSSLTWSYKYSILECRRIMIVLGCCSSCYVGFRSPPHLFLFEILNVWKATADPVTISCPIRIADNAEWLCKLILGLRQHLLVSHIVKIRNTSMPIHLTKLHTESVSMSQRTTNKPSQGYNTVDDEEVREGRLKIASGFNQQNWMSTNSEISQASSNFSL